MLMRKGLATALKYHEERTVMPYRPFKIKAKGDPVVGRCLQDADDLVSLFMHNKYKVLNTTRCAHDEDSPNGTLCALCRVKCPRSLRTFIPFFVRPNQKNTLYEKLDDPQDRLTIIEYGARALEEVAGFISEYGELTQSDVKIKRVGEEKATQYKWYPVRGSERPLNAEERALVVPDLTELIQIKEGDELEKLAMQFERADGVLPTNGNSDGTADLEEDEIPF
jgi:hypothetical protein